MMTDRAGNARGRMRWPRRRQGCGTDSLPLPLTPEARRWDLGADWQAIQQVLAPVSRRWDLAILANLDEHEGRTPGDVRAAINAQADADHQLGKEVLSVRLRALEQDGYIRHDELRRIPYLRLFYLCRPGLDLMSGLAAIALQDRRLVNGSPER